MTDDELRIKVAELCGFVRVPHETDIIEPLKGMELVCGNCRAVVFCTDRYNWNVHEHCGPHGCDCYGGKWTLFASVWIRDNKVKSLPDYPNDLNAMAEAEKTLSPEQQEDYAHNLSQLIPQNENCGPALDSDVDIMVHRQFDLLHATARQRAEAFVATLTK